MQVKTGDNCELITVNVPQLADLFRGGLVEEIDVRITYNCCDSYEFVISSDTSDCVWTVYGDYLANPFGTGDPITFTGICGLRMLRWDGNDFVTEWPFGPFTDEGECEGCLNLADPTERQELTNIVNDWLANNGGGEFTITMSNGVSNTPYDESIAPGSVFTMSFEGLDSDLRPSSWFTNFNCGYNLGGVSGGFYDQVDRFFACGGLSTADFVFNENQVKIRPTIMGKSVFPDGVYGIEVTAIASDGTKTSVKECVFMDCELGCKALQTKNTEAFLIYYLLKETGECDCDCQTLCDLLKLTY